MNTLVLVAHPDLDASRVNRTLLDALLTLHDSEDITVRDLYAAYPDGRIDVPAEQALVEASQRIIFQFPLYWYSSPSLLHQWLSEVLVDGWAYGNGGRKMADKLINVATTIGSPAESYTAEGAVGFTIDQVLVPFAATAVFVGSTFGEPFTIFGVAENYSGDQLEADAKRYAEWVQDSPQN
ncbi:NAD(P)H-dependent oxidoreductase [Actinomycetaceae bacterium MB13-C1-2]|nr:NAD(P)H-dependent oxidoreductase [Actinomycetaceae bacterium MB13-C1-2]